MATNTDSTTPPPDYETLIDLSDIDMSSLEFTGVYHSSLGFDFPGTEHRQTAAADRRVKIIIKDGHDDKGPGMTFEIKYFAKLQAAFDCFKAASCKTCRAIDDIRFKTVEKRIDEFDTPKKASRILITCGLEAILTFCSLDSSKTPRLRSAPGPTCRVSSARGASLRAIPRRMAWSSPHRRAS